MENTAIEQADDGQRQPSLQKLDQQIIRIERIIKELLDEVRIEDLNTEKRLVIGARFITLHQRGVALRHIFEQDQATGEEDVVMGKLMSLMRGEIEMELEKVWPIVDASNNTGPITPYREVPGLE